MVGALPKKNKTMKIHTHIGYGFFAFTREKREKKSQNKNDFLDQLARKIVDYDEQYPNPEYECLHGSVYYRAWL